MTSWRKKASERSASSKGLSIYELAVDSITTRGEDPYIWLSQNQCVDLLSATQNAADEIISQMRNIAETIPEYKVLRAMHGVGDRLGPIILAEIGDVHRFHSGKALNSLCRQRCPSISIRTIREQKPPHFKTWQLYPPEGLLRGNAGP